MTGGILIDTPILLWTRTDPEILKAGELRAIEGRETVTSARSVCGNLPS